MNVSLPQNSKGAVDANTWLKILSALLLIGVLGCGGVALKNNSTRSEYQHPSHPLSLIAFQDSLKTRSDSTSPPQSTVNSKLLESTLYRNLEHLECGIPLRMALSSRATVLRKYSTAKATNSSDDIGVIFLAQLSNRDIMMLISTVRPNRTSIVRISDESKCTLLFDSFKLDLPLNSYETTIGFVNEVTWADKNTFRLVEESNELSGKLSNHSRQFLLKVLHSSVKMKVLN